MKTLSLLSLIAVVIAACGPAHAAAVREQSTEQVPVVRIVNDRSEQVRVYDGPRLIATVLSGESRLALLEPGLRERPLVVRGLQYERTTRPAVFSQNARWELVINFDGAVDLNLRTQ